MEITITKYNIDNFVSHLLIRKQNEVEGKGAKNIFNDIIEIKWQANVLNESIIEKFPNLRKLILLSNIVTSLDPLINCINLQELHIKHNQITSLDPLVNCINLRFLDCSYNKISSLKSLTNCINLQELNCNSNQISSLNSLADCINLRMLNCRNNKITSLGPLINCTNLRDFYCGSNKIISLDPLANYINLQTLYCYDNQITSLNPLTKCINLRVLHCGSNKIILLDPLSNCINIQELNCNHNQIISLECLVYLRRLVLLCYYDNPLSLQSVQVHRFLDRLNIINPSSSIYQDGQNVHDVTIQKTVCESLQSLLRDEKPLFSIDDIINSNLNSKTKESLIEYCQNESVHSVHLITYGELLGYVWQRINKSDYKEELFKILEEQIAESECKCFTGRFNRTLSILVGFYDDIKINISDNARIGAIIIACKDRIIPYDPIDHKKLVEMELTEAGYTADEIKPWIDAIDE
jgi:internalin A